MNPTPPPRYLDTLDIATGHAKDTDSWTDFPAGFTLLIDDSGDASGHTLLIQDEVTESGVILAPSFKLLVE